MIKRNQICYWLLAILLIIIFIYQYQQSASAVRRPQSAVNILCIGDSITQGGNVSGEYTYRYPLYHLLKSEQHKVDFIGSRQKGLQDKFKWPKHMDLDHEGYYGKKMAFVEKVVIKKLDTLKKPDIVIMHLGTNDNDVSVESIGNPIKRLVNALREKNPRVKVFLVQIPGWKKLTMHFHIWRAAKELSTDKSPVQTIPLYKFWDANIHTFDGIHPNRLGQQKMAKLFYKYIRSK